MTGVATLIVAALTLAVALASAQTSQPATAAKAPKSAKVPAADPESATKFAGVTDAEAWDLARGLLPADFALPLGSAPTGTRVASDKARSAASAAASPTTPPADAKVEYLSDRSALVQAAGKTTSSLVASTFPLRTKDAKGRLQPLDLRLRPSGQYLVPGNAGTRVKLARNLQRSSRLSDIGLTVRTVGSQARPATARQASTAFYANAAKSTDVSLSAEPGGMQAMWVLRAASSPQKLQLALGAKAIKLRKRPTNEVVVRGTGGKPIALVRAPVAWDARGVLVPVKTSVKGGNIVYRVAHRGRELQYPIVVDPVIETWTWTTAGAPNGWTATAATGHSSAVTSGLRLSYTGPRTTPGIAEWKFTAPSGAAITSYAPGTIAMTSTGTNGATCSSTGLRTAAGAAIQPTATNKACTATLASGPFVSAVTNTGNVAFFKHEPVANTATATATLPNATLHLDDANTPAIGATTYSHPVNGWTRGQAMWAKPTVTDAGLGVKTASISRGGTVLETETVTCNGGSVTCPPSVTPQLDFDTSGLSEGTPYAFSINATDVLNKAATATTFNLRVDNGIPNVDLTGPMIDSPITHDEARALTIAATDGSAAETDPAKQRAGVKSIRVTVDDAPANPDTVQGTCAHGCPLSRTFQFDPNQFTHGNHTVKAIVTDQAGNATTVAKRVSVDTRGPRIGLSGPLMDARGSTLTKESYRLDIVAIDGVHDASPESGANDIEVLWQDTATGTWTQLDYVWRECKGNSCSLEHQYTFEPRRFPGAGRLAVKTNDAFGNTTQEFIDLTPSTTAAFETTALSGLEEYLQLDSVATGGGGRAHVNQTTGNLVWNLLPLMNPGRGLSTFANVTYNSQTKAPDGTFTPYDEIGPGFSLGLSTITRVNEPLDLAAVNDTNDPRITLVDPDGTRHVFRKHSSGLYYTPPAGFNVHLRKYSSAYDRWWAATRPDGATYFFDERGFPTYIEDRNNNILKYTYEIVSVAAGVSCPTWGVSIGSFNAAQCRQRLVAVTDSAGVRDGAPNRSVTLQYEAGNAGRIASITDQGGRVLRFTYSGGRLSSITQASGTPSERVHRLLYGPEGLGVVQDPRGGETRFTYTGGHKARLAGTSPAVDELSDIRVSRVTQRDRRHRDYTYAKAPAGSLVQWQSAASDARGEVTKYQTDQRGRTFQVTDPRGTITNLKWDGDNNVTEIVEAAGQPEAARTTMGYNPNGQLEWVLSPKEHRTDLHYASGKGLFQATAGEGLDDFVTDLTEIETPKGDETGTPGDFADLFEIDARGNVTGRRDGEGNWARTWFDSFGRVVKETDPMGNVTRYEQFHPSGQATVMIDPKQGRWEYTYDAVGNLRATSDPRGAEFGGVSDAAHRFQARFEYDALDQLVAEILPKDSRAGEFITRTYDYDRNGNGERSVDGTGAASTAVFDEMDRPTALRTPSVTHAGDDGAAPEITRYEYDGEGLVTREQRPRGEENQGSSVDFSTDYEYDGNGQLVVERKHQLEPDGSLTSLVTSMAYDRRGNLKGVVDPRTNADSSLTPLQTAATDVYRRWRFDYDPADRLVMSVESPHGAEIFRKYTYDSNDNVTILESPLFAEAYRHYDGRDMLVAQTDEEGNRTTYQRRADGLVERIIHPRYYESGYQENEHVERFVYDAFGDVVEHHLPRTDVADEPEAGYVWKYRRDAVGDPTKVTDPRGKSYDNTFLDAGVLRSTTRPSAWKIEGGALVQKSWQEIGSEPSAPALPAAEGDYGTVAGAGMPDLLPKAGKTAFGYDAELRLSTVTELLDQATAADDVTSRLDRDALGRLTKVTRPRDTKANAFITERTAYDRNGNVAETTDGENVTTRLVHDQFDRLVEHQAPPGSSGQPEVTKYTYTPNDQVESVTTPRDTKSYSCYDTVDRLVSQTDPLGGYSAYEYDDAGNLLKEKSPRGFAQDTSARCDQNPTDGADTPKHTTERTYDEIGRVETVRDGLASGGQLWEYEYDAASNVTKVIAPGANADATAAETAASRRTTTYVHDGRGFPYRTTVQRAGGTPGTLLHTIQERDGNGNLRRVVNPTGAKTGAPATLANEAPAQTSIASESDRENGGVALATRESTLYEYSDDNILTAIHLPTRNSADERYRQTFHLDQRGRTHQIDAPNEWTKAPAVCEKGKLDQSFDDPLKTACVQRTTLEHFDTGWIRRSIEPAGARRVKKGPENPTGIVPTGGEHHEYDYDDRGLQKSWTVKNSGGVVRRTTTRSYWPNGLLANRLADRAGTREEADKPREYDYRWTKNGQLASVLDRGLNISPGQPGDDRVFRLGYDLNDRLVATDEDDRGPRAGQDTAMKLDIEGNVTKRWHNGKLPTDGGVSNGTVDTEKFTNFVGVRTDFEYDDWNRETKATVNPQNENDVRQQIDTGYWPSGEKRERFERTFGGQSNQALTLRSTERYGWTMDGLRAETRRAPATKNTTYTYDENGYRLGESIAGTPVKGSGYDVNARGQMTQWRRVQQGTAVDYVLNGAGDVLRKTDTGTDTKVVLDHRYAVGRLVETLRTTTPVAGGASQSRTERYGYDTAANNVISVNRVLNPGQESDTAQPLASFVYDPFDRVVEQKLHLGTTTTVETDDGYDRETFEYDAFDRRDVHKESQKRGTANETTPTTTDYSYVGITDALSRRTPLTRSDSKHSTWDYDSNLEAIGQGRRTETGDLTSYRTLAKDVNGTVEALLGTTGAAATNEQYEYDPYGTLVDPTTRREPGEGLLDNTLESGRSTEAKDNPVRFQGFHYDSGVRTYDMRARSYLPSAGRFLTQDRYEDASGDFNLVSDPLTQNRYAFAGGNPVSNVEFDGHAFRGGGGIGGTRNPNNTPDHDNDRSTGTKPRRVPTNYTPGATQQRLQEEDRRDTAQGAVATGQRGQAQAAAHARAKKDKDKDKDGDKGGPAGRLGLDPLVGVIDAGKDAVVDAVGGEAEKVATVASDAVRGCFQNPDGTVLQDPKCHSEQEREQAVADLSGYVGRGGGRGGVRGGPAGGAPPGAGPRGGAPRAPVAPRPSAKGRLKAVGLPTRGTVRYVPPPTWRPTHQLPRGKQGGFKDRFGNEWVPGPTRTPGQSKEWDVQLSETGRNHFGHRSRDGRHLNVNLNGEITH